MILIYILILNLFLNSLLQHLYNNMSIILIFKKFVFLVLKVKDVFDFPMSTLGIEPKTCGLKARRSAN